MKRLQNHSAVEMRISAPVLEDVCKKMIEVILHCLPQAIRGTIYKVGPMPQLRVVRVASGYRDLKTDQVVWDGAIKSDYALPGKVWHDYRDRPGRVLEAMAWCVERQTSWTTDNPEENVRSERKLLEGKAREDYHHMEPVLVEKTDLWDVMPSPGTYPKDYEDRPIWQGSPYAIVAVIKIHFLKGCVRRYDRSTKVIKELSKSLGTQMLSLHAREVTFEREKQLSQERQSVCNTLAHEFRNLTPKIGFAYRAINNEIAYLRELWENLVYEQIPEQLNKRTILQQLEKILEEVALANTYPELTKHVSMLSRYQKQLKDACLLPHHNEVWLEEKIRPMWGAIFSKIDVKSTVKEKVEDLFQDLRASFRVGQDQELRDKVKIVPEDLKTRWIDLVYRELNGNTNGVIQEYIDLLKEIDLDLPHKNHSLKNFIYLKALVEVIPEIEKKVNQRLEAIKREPSIGHRAKRIE